MLRKWNIWLFLGSPRLSAILLGSKAIQRSVQSVWAVGLIWISPGSLGTSEKFWSVFFRVLNFCCFFLRFCFFWPPGDPGDLRKFLLPPLAQGLGPTTGTYWQELTVCFKHFCWGCQRGHIETRFCLLFIFDAKQFNKKTPNILQ